MRLIVIFILVFSALLIPAQSEQHLTAVVGHGFFIPHRPTLPPLLKGPTRSYSLRYSARVQGDKDWHARYGRPRLGFSATLLELGNRTDLGSMYTIYPFIDFGLNGKDERGLLLHLGVGMAYLNKRFDNETNFANQAIGSHVNYSIVIGTAYRYRWRKLQASLGLTMSHASNAAIQLPNLGINMVTTDFGLAYQLSESISTPLEVTEVESRNKNLEAITSFGLRDANSFSDTRYLVTEARLRYVKPFSPKCSYLVGLDVIHNKATYAEENLQSGTSLGLAQAGINGGIALDFGSSKLYLQQGVYVWKGDQNEGLLYHRFGGAWKLSKRVLLDLSLKTHFAKADYLALGVGYVFATPASE